MYRRVHLASYALFKTTSNSTGTYRAQGYRFGKLGGTVAHAGDRPWQRVILRLLLAVPQQQQTTVSVRPRVALAQGGRLNCHNHQYDTTILLPDLMPEPSLVTRSELRRDDFEQSSDEKYVTNQEFAQPRRSARCRSRRVLLAGKAYGFFEMTLLLA